MKKIRLPGRNLSPSQWGKLLLASGLLLVFVQGVLQLHEVQNFFFPGRYYALKLNLIRKEYSKIDGGLSSLQAQLGRLTRLQEQQARHNLFPLRLSLSNSSSPPSADGDRFNPDSSWQSMFHAAQKKRVYVARKLHYIDLILKAMHRDLEAQSSGNGSASPTKKAGMEKTLQQIRGSQALGRTFHDNLKNLSEKLEKLAEGGASPKARNVPYSRAK